MLLAIWYCIDLLTQCAPSPLPPLSSPSQYLHHPSENGLIEQDVTDAKAADNKVSPIKPLYFGGYIKYVGIRGGHGKADRVRVVT